MTGGSFRGLYHQAHDLTVRDVRVHHCPAHGILGADQGSGSLTLDHVEVDHCGNGTSQHQIYVATDEVHHPGSVFRIFDGIQSVEMHDNVFCRADGGAPNLIRTAEAEWTDGEQIAGRNNWVRTGASNEPAQWTGTLYGTDPGLADLGASDPRPSAGISLRNAAATDLSGPPVFPFPDPEYPALFHPPLHTVSAPGQEAPRPFDCAPDVGAYEFPPAAAVVARLKLAQGGALSWDRAPGVSAYDVVKGDLALLASSDGDLASSLLACLENESPDAAATDGETPEAGGGFYYLVRGTPGGTYDSGCPGQAAPRDAGVAASPAACP